MATAAAIVGTTIIGGVVQDRSSRRAQRSAEQGQQRSIAANERQQLRTEERFRPFLEAATSDRVFDRVGFGAATDDFAQRKQAIFDQNLTRQEEINQLTALNRDAPVRNDFFAPGALQQLQSGIDNAPGTPQIDQFGGQAVAAPELQQFEQSNRLQQFETGAPNLQEFNFDPNEALNSPALNFQRQLGEQQLDRVAGKNRQLNSGQRLIDAVKFGQGLATQSLDTEFNRQRIQNNQNNQIAQQGFGNEGNINQIQNRITGQNNLIDQGNVGRVNQIATQQQQLDRQNLGDRLNVSNVNQNRLIQQFGLDNSQFNQRLDRLSGIVNVASGAGQAVSNLGAQNAQNIGNILQQQGSTQAAGQIGRANNLNNTINQGVNAAAQFGLFNPQPQQLTQFGTIPGSQQTNLLQQQQVGF